MKLTPNLSLKKPEGTDVVDIADLNGNADILDAAVTGKVDKVAGKGLSTEDYTTAEKNKLAGVAAGANNYVHPSGDGNQHIPATGTGNNGKVLKAGATAGSAAWGIVDWGELGGKPSTFTPSAHQHDASDINAGTLAAARLPAATTSVQGAMSAADKSKLDGIAAAAGTLGSATDTVIGNRIIDDTVTAATGADTPTRLWSKLANMIKTITGKGSWVTAPRTTLENAVKLNGDTMTGALTLPSDPMQAMHAVTRQYTDNLPVCGMDRNAVINGNFDVWQRGTSFANTGGLQFFADRWSGYVNTVNQASAISRQDGSGVPGSLFCLRYKRNSGQTGVNPFVFAQSLETSDVKKLVGKKLTLSFWARIGAGNTGTSLKPSIVSGTGTDQNTITGFTGFAEEASALVTLTTTWQKFSVTTANPIATGKSGLAFQFSYTPSGTAGVNDYVDIAQVQVNAGDVALSHQPRSFAEEMQLCQRYYSKSFRPGVTPAQNAGRSGDHQVAAVVSTGSTDHVVSLPVTMRIPPTVTFYNPAAANALARNIPAGTDGVVIMNVTGAGTKESSFGVSITIPANTTVGQVIEFHWTADAEL